MTNTSYSDRIHRILPELNPEQSPESLALLRDYEADDLSPFELATELAKCDKTSDMPRVLFDFLVDLYSEECRNGNDWAMNDLGALYYDGRGCEQDFKKAVFYFDMAAKNGNRQAQENLGYCYYYGRNMPVDYEKAFHYFALGAFDGHLISLYKIGDMYQNGYYVEKNPAEAFNIYMHCIDMMTEEASVTVAGPVYLRLGHALLNGNGVEASAKSALICFQKAEAFLYDMVADGEEMYKKSLRAAIDGQAKARAVLEEALPKQEWTVDL